VVTLNPLAAGHSAATCCLRSFEISDTFVSRSHPPLHPTSSSSSSALNRATDHGHESRLRDCISGILGSKNTKLGVAQLSKDLGWPKRGDGLPDHIARPSRTLRRRPSDRYIAFGIPKSSSQGYRCQNGQQRRPIWLPTLKRSPAPGSGNSIRSLLCTRVGATCCHRHRISRDDVCRNMIIPPSLL
jgi:hypothetical protein